MQGAVDLAADLPGTLLKPPKQLCHRQVGVDRIRADFVGKASECINGEPVDLTVKAKGCSALESINLLA